jgi:hypothetical protein
MIECVNCGGLGCESCEGGRIIIDRCPQEMVGSQMQSAINLVGFAERNLFPEAGGALDQSQYFLNLFSIMQTEIQKIQQEDAERSAARAKKAKRHRRR